MKTKNNNIKFTERQLELILYACELTIDGRKYKDRVVLEAIITKLIKSGVRQDYTID